jgi:hypothetical protein
MSYRKIVFSTFLIIFFLFLFSCSKLDTDWHRYHGRQQDIIGRNKVKVISDGWKIIGKTEDKKYYEWGWEVILIVSEEKDYNIIETKKGWQLIPIPSIKEIEYILYDKDGFELVRDKIVAQRNITFEKNETFRKTSILSKSQAIRAVKSAYRIVTD